jgi:Flp pilus assembly protein TadB
MMRSGRPPVDGTFILAVSSLVVAAVLATWYLVTGWVGAILLALIPVAIVVWLLYWEGRWPRWP